MFFWGRGHICGFTSLDFIFAANHVLGEALFFFFLLVFRDRVSLYSPGYPGSHSVDQAGLELRNLPASALVLGLKACATTAQQMDAFL